MGSKDSKSARDKDARSLFKMFSLGVSTNRDSIVYDFLLPPLLKRVAGFCDIYNSEVQRFERTNFKGNVDEFVDYSKTQWSSTLKNHLKQGLYANFDKSYVRTALYRPFMKQELYYDPVLIDRPAHFKEILPTKNSGKENLLICISGVGSFRPFHCLVSNRIPCLDMLEKTQCFPFYVYDDSGSSRRENITDWSLSQFRSHYSDKKISKWDIFYYIYALLHHPAYRTKYAANLRRSLPRIPFAPDFRAFAKAGEKLANLHVNYENQPEYKLEFIENKKAKLDWRVEKMKLSKDKTAVIYNDFLTLSGIPAMAFEYRLGNRSALDWIIDQYQVSTDKRSGIVNDPNNPDDPEYIVKLIGKVVTVSVETVDIVKKLPGSEP
jgi:predicted helicase